MSLYEGVYLAITLLGIVLAFIGGGYWERRKYRTNKDKETMEKFDSLFPYTFMKFIHEHDFGASFSASLLETIGRLLDENKNPNFFFLDKELENLKGEFVTTLDEFSELVAMNSGLVGTNNDTVRIPVMYDNATHEEMQVIREVHQLASKSFQIYSELQKKARQKL